MKPLTIAILLTLCSLAVRGQTPIRESQVPPIVKEDFGHRFRDAEEVIWLQQGSDYYGARYILEGREGEVVYLPNGHWVQTTEKLEYKELPDDARQYCREHYGDYSAFLTQKLLTRNYGVLYKAVIRKESQQVTMTFDMHGKLIEETRVNLEDVIEKKPGLKGKLGGLLEK